MRKVLAVAKQELRINIRRKGFVFGVIGLPLLMSASFIIPVLLIGELSVPDEFRVGIVDHAGILNESRIEIIEKGENPFINISNEKKVILIKFEDEKTVERAYESKEISAYYIIPENFPENFTVMKKTRGFLDADRQVELKIAEKYGEMAFKFASGIRFESLEKREKGAMDFVLPAFIPLLLFVAIFTSSGYLMQGIVEEKESRVMEILLSSASPHEVFAGKFIGNAVTGLIQASVWLGLAGVFSGFMLSMNLITPEMVIISAVYFILGYLLYSSVLAAIASVSTTLRDAQQATSAVVFIGIFPAIFLSQMSSFNPESQALKAFSLFPFTSPALMPALYSSGSVGVLMVVLGAIILAATSLITLKISARIFGYYALSYSKPKWHEVIKSAFRSQRKS